MSEPENPFPRSFNFAGWKNIVGYLEPHSKLPEWRGAAMALNGVALRFVGAERADRRYMRAILNKRAFSSDAVRIVIEEALFAFVTNATAVIECFFHAMFWCAVVAHANGFESSNLKLYPADVLRLFEKSFPDSRLTKAMSTALGEPRWHALKDLRDALSHRGILPWTIYEGRHPLDVATTGNPKTHPSDWDTSALVTLRTLLPHAWLIGTSHRLLDAGERFTREHFWKPIV
jgi:hypothetical protein